MKNLYLLPPQKKQQGSILLLSLFILLGITLLTLSASKSTLMQQKVTSHTKDSLLALQVAEAALLEAQSIATLQEYTVNGGSAGFYDGECNVSDTGCYLASITDPFADGFWGNSTLANNSIQCGNGDNSCNIKGRFIIIRLGKVAIAGGSSNDVTITTNQYQNPDDANNGTAYRYKIIAKGSGINVGVGDGVERVLIAYHASSE